MTGAGAAWEGMRSTGTVRLLAPGEVVFREGDEADGAYVVLSGCAQVIEGDEHVAVLGQGELFGEIGALGGGTRTATVVAAEESELLFLATDLLRAGMAGAPELVWDSLRVMARRLRGITARQAAYRDEHKALREVQRSLLPDVAELDLGGQVRVEAVWEPCTYASGDYYDVIRIDERRVLVALGDVMGHGAAASLMMAVARAQVRELARRFRRVDELLLVLDGYLRDNGPQRQGMSLVVGVLDTEDLVLEWASAGHPPPILLRDGTAAELAGRGGILLALPFLLGSGYERREVALRPGDRLLMATDGLFEIAVDEEGTQLGREGLAETLARLAADGPGDVLGRLLAEVAALDRAPAAEDDRSALLLTVS